MKLIRAGLLTGILLCFNSGILFSQSRIYTYQPTYIEPYYLTITLFKTTHLIFPFGIISADRGSRDILVQKAQGVENVLLVKAGRENFIETNLSVITTDGKLYSFIVGYSDKPASLTLYFSRSGSQEEGLPLLTGGINEAVIHQQTEQIAQASRTISHVKDSQYKLQLRLNGVFIKDDVIFFQLEVKNHSHIRYDTDILRFFIRDRQQYKRTASHEIEIYPLYVYGDTSTIKGQSKQILVFAFPKFTIPDKKYLSVQLREKNGGRHLNLKVPNHTLVKARLLVP